MKKRRHLNHRFEEKIRLTKAYLNEDNNKIYNEPQVSCKIWQYIPIGIARLYWLKIKAFKISWNALRYYWAEIVILKNKEELLKWEN